MLTSAEWTCDHDYEKCLCIACAESYASQRVEAFRERAMVVLRPYISGADEKDAAAAIRALEP